MQQQKRGQTLRRWLIWCGPATGVMAASSCMSLTHTASHFLRSYLPRLPCNSAQDREATVKVLAFDQDWQAETAVHSRKLTRSHGWPTA